MQKAAQVMESPADLINAAIETLLQEQYELPAFSTLDRMATRIRHLVNGGFYQSVLARLTTEHQQTLSSLLRLGPVCKWSPAERKRYEKRSINR